MPSIILNTTPDERSCVLALAFRQGISVDMLVRRAVTYLAFLVDLRQNNYDIKTVSQNGEGECRIYIPLEWNSERHEADKTNPTLKVSSDSKLRNLLKQVSRRSEMELFPTIVGFALGVYSIVNTHIESGLEVVAERREPFSRISASPLTLLPPSEDRVSHHKAKYGIRTQLWALPTATAVAVLITMPFWMLISSQKRVKRLESALLFSQGKYEHFDVLLKNPETITGSGVAMGGIPEHSRQYGRNTVSITYGDFTTKRLPYIVIAVIFKYGSSDVVDSPSTDAVHLLAKWLKFVMPADARFAVEVHAITATISETDERLSRARAQKLQMMLEKEGAPHSMFFEPRGFGNDAAPVPTERGNDSARISTPDAVVLLIRYR